MSVGDTLILTLLVAVVDCETAVVEGVGVVVGVSPEVTEEVGVRVVLPEMEAVGDEEVLVDPVSLTDGVSVAELLFVGVWLGLSDCDGDSLELMLMLPLID